ncbi:hypothetical protein F5Y04DRAFT_263367 [Hypomontagnella monticulosa]|nr:hypothetical protein F5Y04DRAFT_263367 [Hypomontagnella monticulosa]
MILACQARAVRCMYVRNARKLGKMQEVHRGGFPKALLILDYLVRRQSVQLLTNEVRRKKYVTTRHRITKFMLKCSQSVYHSAWCLLKIHIKSSSNTDGAHVGRGWKSDETILAKTALRKDIGTWLEPRHDSRFMCRPHRFLRANHQFPGRGKVYSADCPLVPAMVTKLVVSLGGARPNGQVCWSILSSSSRAREATPCITRPPHIDVSQKSVEDAISMAR